MTLKRALEIKDHAKREQWDFSPAEGLEARQVIKRLEAAAPELVEALRAFARLGIETCSRCGGDGKASQVNEACGQCGGTGKDTHNPDPSDIEHARNLLAKLED